MPKGKTKTKPKKLDRFDILTAQVETLSRRIALIDEDLDDHDAALTRLDDAICPRVAARLTALERLHKDQYSHDTGVNRPAQPPKDTLDANAKAKRDYILGSARPTCTLEQVTQVAIKLNAILRNVPWDKLPAPAQNMMIARAHWLIHAVQSVMG